MTPLPPIAARHPRRAGLPSSLALAVLLGGMLGGLASPGARAQPVDMTKGGPVEVTSTNGIEWRQAEQVVIATGNAKAVRDGVTLTADRLVARYRNRAGQANGDGAAPAPAAEPGGDSPASNGEIWRLEAEGNVHIETETDHAQGDRGVYDMDQAVMVLTGRNLRLTTPDDTITARDSLEYWPQKRMAVARGDRGVYSPVTGIARLLGNVRITRGQNQLNGSEAIVDMRSGLARLVSAPGARVQGLVVPQSGDQPGGQGNTQGGAQPGQPQGRGR